MVIDCNAQVVVLFAFMLPLALLAALAATIGLVLAHSGLLCARLSAWMSALVTLAAANMLVASLGGKHWCKPSGVEFTRGLFFVCEIICRSKRREK